jgi:hypothetical protein
MNITVTPMRTQHIMKRRPGNIFGSTSWITSNLQTFESIDSLLKNGSTTFDRVHLHKIKCTYTSDDTFARIIVKIYQNTSNDFLIEFHRIEGCTFLFNNVIRDIMLTIDDSSLQRPL